MLLIMRSRKAERKPLSFSTTMRNPNRIVSFLNCLLPYENQILTHDVIMKVVHNAIKEKLYTPVVVNRTPDLVYILRKYSLQGTTQGNGLTGGVPPVRFSM